MTVPVDNPITPEKVELGKMLFFDKRLGKDGKMSCETCHLPEKGWADAKQFSTKFDGKPNTRNTPTLYNVGFYKRRGTGMAAPPRWKRRSRPHGEARWAPTTG